MYALAFYTLLFLNLASAGLVTGGVMVMAAAYNPLLAELPQRETLLVHRGIGKYIDRWQPKMALLAIVTGVIEIWFSQQLWQTICILLGVAGILALSTISRLVSVPLSRRIVAWTPDAGDGHLTGMKTQWIWAHYVRATCALLGFLFFIASLLIVVTV